MQCYATNYYVNDNSTTGDVYCSVIGNNSNDGLSTSTPMATLEYLWNTYGPSGTNVITSGDIIYVDAGNYFETDANLAMSVDGISIIGAGYNLTIFDNNQTSSDANRWGTVTGDNITLEGFYITGYNYGVGDAFALQVTGANNLTVTNVMVNDNLPGGGSSAIVIKGGSSVTFNGGGSSCNPGAASVAGGGVNVEGSGNTVSFDDYIFSNNKKDLQGGSGLYVVGDNTTTVTVTDSKFTDNENYAAQGGGAVYLSGSNLTITGSCFTDNFAYYTGGPNYGGAICVARGSTLTISECSFSGNYAQTSGKGGAIGINTSFSGSGSTATVNVTNCSFASNSSGEGADLYARVGYSNPAIYNVNNCTFSGTGLDIRDDNTAQINIQNSGNPSTSGTGINKINTIPASGSPATNCPSQNAPCYSIILPVELLFFSVDCNDDRQFLSWSTASEFNNDRFVIEASVNGDNFTTIAQVPGAGTTSLESDYVLNLGKDDRWNYFKLSQVDYDGHMEVFPTIMSHRFCDDNTLEVQYDVFSKIFRFYANVASGQSQLMLVNSMGQTVLSERLQFDNGQATLNVQDLNSGIYIISFQSDKIVETVKIFIP